MHQSAVLTMNYLNLLCSSNCPDSSLFYVYNLSKTQKDVRYFAKLDSAV